jgi:hypothetical protein
MAGVGKKPRTGLPVGALHYRVGEGKPQKRWGRTEVVLFNNSNVFI